MTEPDSTSTQGLRNETLQQRLRCGLIYVLLVWLLPATFIGLSFALLMMLKHGRMGWEAFIVGAIAGLVIGVIRVAAWTYQDYRRYE